MMTTERFTCINTEGYQVSLVLNAVYESLPDDDAAKYNLIRVIDESGEDYLYPAAYFESAEMPAKEPERVFHTHT